jgi:pimeloyl-ACP methyl ester carboxylesterase
MGHQEIWLAGISIGGFIAIDYADRHPGRIDALCLLAPYPGNRMVTGEIGAAGGIHQWPGDAAEDDAERRVWRWMKHHRRLPAAPRVHLGYGQDDRFAPGLRLMAEALPADCVDAVPGGHDWPAWRRLWGNFLDRTMDIAQ